MTFEEIKQSDKLWLTPAEVAPVVGADPQAIRWMAHNQPELLGFPVTVIKTRTKIPRLPFVAYLEGTAIESPV